MTTAPASRNAGRTVGPAAGLLTLVIVGLHFWLLFHAGAFCGDEVNVINLADTHSLSAMTHDSFPVLLPLLVSGWQAAGLGGSDLGLRSLGCLTGIGLVGALWLVAWRARRAPPLLGLVLLGLNGTAIFWTDYLRAYGLGSLLILLALAALCFLLEKPTWKRTAILAVTAVLSVQALYQNAVFFAAIGVGGWVVCWLRKDKSCTLKILAAALAAMISLLPYLGPLQNWQQATTIRPGFSFKAALDNLCTVLGFPVSQYIWLWAALGGTVMVLGVAALFRGRAALLPAERGLAPIERRALAATVLLSSVAGYYVFLHLAALITSPWYFVPLLVLAAASFDLGLSPTDLPGPWRLAAASLLVGTAGLSVAFAVRDLNCRFSNMDLVADRLAAKVEPQDYVVVTPWYFGISFHRYYHGGAAWDSLPPVADHSGYRFDLVPATAPDLARAMQPVYDRATIALKSGHRVWVVGWMSVPAPGHRAASETGRFLAEHSGSFAAVDLKIQGQTSDYENVSLLEADGWRAAPP